MQHLDKWSDKADKVSWKTPDGLNPDLYKVFERCNLGEKAMLCLWRNGQLNTAIRQSSHIMELQHRLREYSCIPY
ncbi:MAG: hypothetical protein WAM14_21645 [Candidatus Nitrosopolaris sp.]